MNGVIQYIREHLVPACGIAALIIVVAGLLSGFPVGEIIAALFIVAAVIIGGYLVVSIRKKEDVRGTYKIVDAKNPQGEEYRGTLTIEKWNKWLSCKWVNHKWKNPPTKEIDGIGLRVGNALAFSYKYRDSKGVDHTGVMHYRIKIDHLSGKCVEINEPGINEPHAGFEECKKQ